MTLTIKKLCDLPEELLYYISTYLHSTKMCVEEIILEENFKINRSDYYNYIYVNKLKLYDVLQLSNNFQCNKICGDYNIKFNIYNNKSILLCIPVMCKFLPMLKLVDIKSETHLVMLLFTYYYLIKYLDIDINNNIQIKHKPICNIAKELNYDFEDDVFDFIECESLSEYTRNLNLRAYRKDMMCNSSAVILSSDIDDNEKYNNFIESKDYIFCHEKYILDKYALWNNDGTINNLHMFKHELVYLTSIHYGQFICDHEEYDFDTLNSCFDAISIYDAVIQEMEKMPLYVQYIKMVCNINVENIGLLPIQISLAISELVNLTEKELLYKLEDTKKTYYDILKLSL